MAIKDPIEGQEVWFIRGYAAVCGIYKSSSLPISVVYENHWIEVDENSAFNTKKECLLQITKQILTEVCGLQKMLIEYSQEILET